MRPAPRPLPCRNETIARLGDSRVRLLREERAMGVKALAWIVAVFGACSLAAAQEKKEPAADDGKPKFVVDQFEKAWGIKLKSMAVKEDAARSGCVVTLTLEFTKDANDAKELERAFARSTRTGNEIRVIFYLFDEDNVSLGKFTHDSVQGELTGVKGDAFRVGLLLDSQLWAKTRKLEGRILNLPKAKD